ncbi:hypothetical protein Hanom_Chr05g00386521 [Helianthus anomalus]
MVLNTIFEIFGNKLYVSSTAKFDSSGPNPRKAFEYFSSGTSLFLSNFIPNASV